MALAGTPYIEPTDLPAEQIKRLRALGVAKSAKGDDSAPPRRRSRRSSRFLPRSRPSSNLPARRPRRKPATRRNPTSRWPRPRKKPSPAGRRDQDDRESRGRIQRSRKALAAAEYAAKRKPSWPRPTTEQGIPIATACVRRCRPGRKVGQGSGRPARARHCRWRIIVDIYGGPAKRRKPRRNSKSYAIERAVRSRYSALSSDWRRSHKNWGWPTIGACRRRRLLTSGSDRRSTRWVRCTWHPATAEPWSLADAEGRPISLAIMPASR